MKKVLLHIVLSLSFLSGVCAATNSDRWNIDWNKTAFEAGKLAVMTAVPVTMFAASAYALPEQRFTYFIAGIVSAIPAAAGITLFTIDLVFYDPNKQAQTTGHSGDMRFVLAHISRF
ncbi:MAG: hypothetical protein HZC28_13870 [Spirochaetes bacterium]|nr:hypothetical protein [Spirochaetota bacterium]